MSFRKYVSDSTKIVQVSAFLAALQPCWNWTLAFVMGGGLLVATPVMQKFVITRKKALSGSPIGFPTNTVIDKKLVIGGLLFGAGWGMSGFCPGPALVVLMSPQPKVAALCTSMFVGMWCVTGLPKAVGLPKVLQSGEQGARTPMRRRTPAPTRDRRNVIGANQKER